MFCIFEVYVGTPVILYGVPPGSHITLENIKQLSPIEATIELMNSPNYFVNIQILKFILLSLDFLNNILSIQTDVT